MKEMNIPVGVSDLKKIRKNGYYYIDKSRLIQNRNESNNHYSSPTLRQDAGNKYAGKLF